MNNITVTGVLRERVFGYFESYQRPSESGEQYAPSSSGKQEFRRTDFGNRLLSAEGEGGG